MKQKIKANFNISRQFIFSFIKWLLFAIVTGFVGGAAGTAFHLCVEWATGFRETHDWIIFLLPLGGIVIVFLYRITGMTESKGTDEIISSIRTDDRPSILMAPLIFVSTAITHLLGGSAGREGAALQLGGSIGTGIGRLFRLDSKDMSLITLCGMSGVFSALFGTPLTATFFAMEVISVGQIYYAALIPCLASSLTAYGVSLLCGMEPVRFALAAIPAANLWMCLKVALLGAACALMSIVFCLVMKLVHRYAAKWLKNDFLRIAAGGAAVVALTFLLGTRDYNGAGMGLITKAVEQGVARPEAFLLKLIFTAVTIGVGYKGGEIVPTFFVGATFGCVVGGLLGIDPGFAAAVGLVALFCGVVNCPVASIFLSLELFGGGTIYFAIAVAVSYMLSGYYGLYNSQKIVYSKTRAELINIHAR